MTSSTNKVVYWGTGRRKTSVARVRLTLEFITEVMTLSMDPLTSLVIISNSEEIFKDCVNKIKITNTKFFIFLSLIKFITYRTSLHNLCHPIQIRFLLLIFVA